jgi:hypothetical protein
VLRRPADADARPRRAAGGDGFGPDSLNRGFTSPWQPRNAGYTPENAEAMLDAALALIKAKGGKL